MRPPLAHPFETPQERSERLKAEEQREVWTTWLLVAVLLALFWGAVAWAALH